MRLKADIELKFRRFFKKYGKLIIILLIICFLVLIINVFLGKKIDPPSTTFEPQVSILDSSSKVPDKVHNSMEDFIEKYVNYCNEREYSKAYDLISEDCKENYFGSLQNFISYARNKYYEPRCYAIQDYSNFNDKYIYSVKLFDDMLATGLTGTKYRYQEEKMVVSYDENKNIVFSVGDFIEKNRIQSVQENQYLKADIKYQIISYGYEEYLVKLTNRSDYTIIIQNGEIDDKEIIINLGEEYRVNQITDEYILKPGKSITIQPVFSKFYDDGDTTKELILNSIRVIDENGDEVDKLSMTLGF